MRTRWLFGLAATLLASVAACQSGGPTPIAYGGADCRFCRMRIDDPRFGAELVTRTGKALVFDAIECLAGYVSSVTATGDTTTVRSMWVSDFLRPGTLVPLGQARLIRVRGPGSPMGRGLLAVGPQSDLAGLLARTDGVLVSWREVLTSARREADHAGDAGGAPHEDAGAFAR